VSRALYRVLAPIGAGGMGEVYRSRDTELQPSSIASFYAAAGETQLALDWLERAADEHDYGLVGLTSVPRWDILRDQPRFKALLRRMNLAA
jgi:serine/threonine protein kinase